MWRQLELEAAIRGRLKHLRGPSCACATAAALGSRHAVSKHVVKTMSDRNQECQSLEHVLSLGRAVRGAAAWSAPLVAIRWSQQANERLVLH